METTTSPSTEITQKEWDTRKLTSFGYFNSVIDMLFVILIFAAMYAIIIYMIPSSTSPGVTYFWQILITLFFIQGMKKVVSITSPLNSYQTIIIKK
jgi:hypothetical protein